MPTTHPAPASEMAPRYEPAAVEERIRAAWEASGHFTPRADGSRPPFTIMIPPPNVTGVLHMGHALNGTLQDIVARQRRMAGFDVLWLPGTDHAGIATQAVVEKKLYAEKKVTRKQLGREAFLEQVWAWKEEHGSTILQQFKRLGASCDWTRTKFTLDPELSHAVRVAFVRLWEQGLIYRGARLVNWDCVLQTAVSDDEIEYAPRKGKLWRLRYPVKDDTSNRFVEVATTRPETMLGDTGVAVHPDDARYRDLVGATLVLPLVGREIPVVADASVDPSFGTGAVKVTPGHDPADYERGARHGLPIVNILERDGTLAAVAGPFAGLPREKAREAVVAALAEQGLLGDVTDFEHNVPLSDRSKSPIEPLVSEQWFVRMAPLAAPAIEAVADGSLRFQPERWTKVYLDWLHNVRDWCISRQLWWGHRIPVWYDEDGEPVASVTDLQLGAPHPKTGKPLVRQDDDVLDTWASSWLWPMATLGWPERTHDLDTFYPTQFLSTASEIIYLWVARMVMAGYAFMDDRPKSERCPFATCYIHATVLDAQGRRMSKSLGNGIDPLDMIEQYGADAVRLSLVLLTKEGQDCKLAPEKFEMGRNFVNKLWNASRFVLSRAGRLPVLDPSAVTALEDRWILSRLAATIDEVTRCQQHYLFNDAAQTLYRFVWNDFCDWYVEAVKPRLGAPPSDARDEDAGAGRPEDAAAGRSRQAGGGADVNGDAGARASAVAGAGAGEQADPIAAAVLGRVLADTLALLHPLTPFVTEAVWQRLREASDAGLSELLLVQRWPDGAGLQRDDQAEADLHAAQTVVSTARRLRQQNDVAERKPVKVSVATSDGALVAGLQRAADIAKRLGVLEELAVGASHPPGSEGGDAAVDVVGPLEIRLDLAGLVDRAAQASALRKSLDKVQKQLAAVGAKLGNEGFLAKAPADVVEKERQRQAELSEEATRLEGLLAKLG